jgi:hypothetical protein
MIYPNPSAGELFIETNEQIEIQIFNSLGQILMREHLLPGKNQMSLFHLMPGVYFINAAGHFKGPMTKVIKQYEFHLLEDSCPQKFLFCKMARY